MGLTPDTSGLIRKEDVQRLKEWGDEIKRRFDDPVAHTSGKGNVLELRFSKQQEINQIVLQEDISKGHRVKNFIIQAQVNGKWKTIIEGSAIGNKYIHFLDSSVQTKKLRLMITEQFAEPVIQNFAAYQVSNLSM